MQERSEKGVTVVKVPARKKKVVTIKVIATSLQEGYLPRIAAKEGIYMGEGIVSNNDNTCDVMVINSTEKDELIEIKPQEIHPFEYYTPFEDSAESEVEQVPLKDAEQRFNKLQELIQQDHLNKEEKESISKILWKYH